ncbi:MAG: N-acetylneuraminic acid mutarotase [Crocinitomicaceae bacterium]
MKTYSIALLALLFLSEPESAQSQIWQSMPDYPSTARDDGARFIVNNVAYCGTGLTPWWTELGDFYAYDMSSDAWTSIESIPVGEERQYACGFSSATVGYIFGGYSGGNFLNDLWKYDPSTDSWSEQTPLPADGRSGASFFTINDTAYIIGGRTSTLDAVTEIWAYSMSSDTWTAKNDFPYDSLWRAAGTSYDQYGYLIFGRSPSDEYHNELYKYAPSSDSWTQVSIFPGLGRTYASLSPVMGKLIVLGGLDSLVSSYNDMWQFDTLSGLWDQLSSIPALERRGGLAFYSSTAIYYTTGIDLNNTRLTETWKNENPTGNNEIDEISLHVFPNPAHDFLFIESLESNFSIDSYSVLDGSGKMVLYGAEENLSSIDLRDIQSGIYILELTGDHRVTRRKIIKF